MHLKKCNVDPEKCNVDPENQCKLHNLDPVIQINLDHNWDNFLSKSGCLVDPHFSGSWIKNRGSKKWQNNIFRVEKVGKKEKSDTLKMTLFRIFEEIIFNLFINVDHTVHSIHMIRKTHGPKTGWFNIFVIWHKSATLIRDM